MAFYLSTIKDNDLTDKFDRDRMQHTSQLETCVLTTRGKLEVTPRAGFPFQLSIASGACFASGAYVYLENMLAVDMLSLPNGQYQVVVRVTIQNETGSAGAVVVPVGPLKDDNLVEKIDGGEHDVLLAYVNKTPAALEVTDARKFATKNVQEIIERHDFELIVQADSIDTIGRKVDSGAVQIEALWDEKAPIAEAQMSKITKDNGTPYIDLTASATTGNVLESILAGGIRKATIRVDKKHGDTPNNTEEFVGSSHVYENGKAYVMLTGQTSGRSYTNAYSAGAWRGWQDAVTGGDLAAGLTGKVSRSGDSMTGGDLTLFRAPSANMHATTKAYVDAADALKLSLSGGTMGASAVINLPLSPTSANHVTNKAYVDSQNALYLPLAGGTMGASAVINLPLAPTSANHVTNKAYVDEGQRHQITMASGSPVMNLVSKDVLAEAVASSNGVFYVYFSATAPINTNTPSNAAMLGTLWKYGNFAEYRMVGIDGVTYTNTYVTNRWLGWETNASVRTLDAYQSPQITAKSGYALHYRPTNPNLNDFLTGLDIGFYTVELLATMTGTPATGGSVLRGFIHKVGANSAQYLYGTVIVYLVGTNSRVFTGILFGNTPITADDWETSRKQVTFADIDVWTTIFSSTTQTLSITSATNITTSAGKKAKKYRLYFSYQPEIEINTTTQTSSSWDIRLWFASLRDHHYAGTMVVQSNGNLTFTGTSNATAGAQTPYLYRVDAVL